MPVWSWIDVKCRTEAPQAIARINEAMVLKMIVLVGYQDCKNNAVPKLVKIVNWFAGYLSDHIGNISVKTSIIALPSLSPACGDYGLVPLKSKFVSAQNHRNLTSEVYHYYLDENGKEVRHGFSSQFDTAGNLVAHARYMDGKVWSGSVAHIYLGWGIGASRSHFAGGKEIRRGFLEGKPLLEGDSIGFVVGRKHVLEIAATDRTMVRTLGLARR